VKRELAEVVLFEAAHEFNEGPEQCREYLRVPGFWFGVSRLPVGATGDTDHGHVNETEIFYCVEGMVEIFDGEVRHLLNAHDALVIPPGIPHTLTNVGSVPALLTWSGAGTNEPQ
jgi:mannose-6-phosphate isomerase-like protein (cupin superfamily)